MGGFLGTDDNAQVNPSSLIKVTSDSGALVSVLPTTALRCYDKLAKGPHLQKEKLTEVVFIKLSHYEGLKEEVSLHSRNADGKTSACIPRQLGQNL